jgi:hypothetical protein
MMSASMAVRTTFGVKPARGEGLVDLAAAGEGEVAGDDRVFGDRLQRQRLRLEDGVLGRCNDTAVPPVSATGGLSRRRC